MRWMIFRLDSAVRDGISFLQWQIREPVIMWLHRSMPSRRCPWNRAIWNIGSFCKIFSSAVPGIRTWDQLIRDRYPDCHGCVPSGVDLWCFWIAVVFGHFKSGLWNSDQWRNVNFYKRNRDILSPQLAIAFGEKISRFLSTQRINLIHCICIS